MSRIHSTWHPPWNDCRAFGTAPVPSGRSREKTPGPPPGRPPRVPVPGFLRGVRRAASGRPAASLRIVRVRAVRPSRVARHVRAFRSSRRCERSRAGVLCVRVRGSGTCCDTRAQVRGQDIDRGRPGPPGRSCRPQCVRDAARRRCAGSAPSRPIQGKGLQSERASGGASCGLPGRAGAKGAPPDTARAPAGTAAQTAAPRHCTGHFSRGRGDRAARTGPPDRRRGHNRGDPRRGVARAPQRRGGAGRLLRTRRNAAARPSGPSRRDRARVRQRR